MKRLYSHKFYNVNFSGFKCNFFTTLTKYSVREKDKQKLNSQVDQSLSVGSVLVTWISPCQVDQSLFIRSNVRVCDRQK